MYSEKLRRVKPCRFLSIDCEFLIQEELGMEQSKDVCPDYTSYNIYIYTEWCTAAVRHEFFLLLNLQTEDRVWVSGSSVLSVATPYIKTPSYKAQKSLFPRF